MQENTDLPQTIDAYIAQFSQERQAILQSLRATIRTAAPDAQEKIAWRMPTFTLKGNLVHFAAFKNHMGFYPTPSAIEAFKNELVPYHSTKGAVQFSYDQPLPHDLISRMVKFRVAENLEKSAAKQKTSKLKTD